jgi:cullin-associated NEDD8-dissociated protein 1
LEKLEKVAIVETVIRPELITEVDLGPFKHKVDEGIPTRKAAYALIDSLVEKIPDRISVNIIVETVIKGLDDTAEECMVLCLHILGRLILMAPAVVISNLDHLVESFDKQIEKNIKLIQGA